MKKISSDVPLQNRYLSKEQFYKKCHISKRTALKLIREGLIPVSKGPTGYLIAVSDVEQYLIDREREPQKYSYCGPMNCQHRHDVSQKSVHAAKEFLQDWPDMLTAEDVAALFGCHPVTVNKWKQKLGLTTILLQHKMYISKSALLDFIGSPQFKTVVPGNTELWTRLNQGRKRR